MIKYLALILIIFLFGCWSGSSSSKKTPDPKPAITENQFGNQVFGKSSFQ